MMEKLSSLILAYLCLKREYQVKISLGQFTILPQKSQQTRSSPRPVISGHQVSYFMSCFQDTCQQAEKNTEEILSNIRQYQGPTFKGEAWKGVSEEAKDLLRQLLNTDYEKRISAGEALKHKWFTNKAAKQCEPLPGILPALEKFSKFNKLKKKALNLMIKNVNEGDIMKFQNMFLCLDKEGTGLITCEALQSCLKSEGYPMTAEELEAITRKINIDGDPIVNYTDFLAAVASTQKFLTDERLWMLFKKMDTDHNGWITETDLKSFLTRPKRLMSIELKGIMKDADNDRDGRITFEDFRQFITCLLYTSDAADDTPCVDLGGRRIIKKKKKSQNHKERKITQRNVANKLNKQITIAM
eukprot:TRINITY_DN9503_c0_g1_i4.p1 TRINITY_DN9503_c0_g1~~TRINITY_DN9503_c0_g1_i4.p1  ORF type:complete len:357 (-),score=54.28 TRINITY_DN9503_c0_g1_i4:19-1089(-)